MPFQPLFVNDTGTLDFSGELVEQMESDDPTDIASEKVPRRHGVYITEEPTRGAKTIRLEGFFRSASLAAVDNRENEILRILNGPRGKFHLNGTSGRFINCYKKECPHYRVMGSGLLVLRYMPELFADDPFWYNATNTTGSQVISASPTTFSHTNPGSEFVYPVWTFAADQGGDITGPFTFENLTTGKTFTFSGTVVSGKSLVIDTANFTVLNDGVNALADVEGTFFLWLISGSNSMKFTGSNCTVSVSYKARFSAPQFT